jgi:hypothetical protein
MNASKTPRSVSSGASTATADFQGLRHQLIERLAYGNWRSNGCPSGTALHDWAEAEKEVDAALKTENVSFLNTIIGAAQEAAEHG